LESVYAMIQKISQQVLSQVRQILTDFQNLSMVHSAEINNKVMIKDLTTPQTLCYTTQWHVSFEY